MKAIVSGGGIAGLAAALSLAQKRWDVLVLEKAASLRTGGYMLDFFGPGFDAAGDLGVLDDLRQKARGVGKVDFIDATGRTRSSVNYAHIRRATQDKLFPILRGDIERVLHSALPATVGIRYGTSIVSVENFGGGVSVALSNGGALEADLLVGAEGIHSATRKLVFGPEEKFIRPLGFHTAGYFFESARVAAALEGDFKMMAIKGRMIGLYEVDPNQIMAFFVMRSRDEAPPTDPRSALLEGFGDLGWIVPEALAAMPEPQEIYFDVVAQIEMPCWHRERTVVIGDAAYAVSLLAGQGASLALAGGRALGQVLGGEGSIEEKLQRFDARLRPLVLEKQGAGRRSAQWFVPQTEAHAVLRDVAVNITNWPIFAGLLGRFFSVSSKGFSLN
jgi:2-polyprenyl-6-methoxyphenol hydroxylase-like FAD-dependent oxidoreductase